MPAAQKPYPLVLMPAAQKPYPLVLMPAAHKINGICVKCLSAGGFEPYNLGFLTTIAFAVENRWNFFDI